MKPTLLTGLFLTACLTALSQGKVNVTNDGASLVTLTTDTSKVFPADRGLAGQAVGNSMPLPSGVVLMAGLYGGTSSSSLFLYTTTASTLLNVAGNPAGFINPFHVVLNANPATGAPAIPGIASGTAIGAGTPWFQVKVWDSAYPSYEAACGKSYVMLAPLFQLNPGPSLSYTFTAPAGPNSTWSEVPIISPLVCPEPSALALVGLGAWTLLSFRRRR